ncbi:hypothetical protein [Nocardia australiensis]|uniref:hypothetical protein n=1 Tax=Nocardia australiensis TaxID=2887191 RepID=UPI001D134E17|nr:hypothetical protein [Nocardia australiensis]
MANSDRFLGKRIRFTVDTRVLDDPEHLLTVFPLDFVYRIVSSGIDRRVALRQAEFPFPRLWNARDYDPVFAAPQVSTPKPPPLSSTATD